MIPKILTLLMFVGTLFACGPLLQQDATGIIPGSANVVVAPTPTPDVSTPTGSLSDERERTVEGKYRDPQFGYEVEVTKGMIGELSWLTATTNGFLVHLPGNGDRSIGVYGEFNWLNFPDIEAAYADAIKQLENDNGTVEVSKKRSLFIDTAPAINFIAKYRLKDSAEFRIINETIIFRTYAGSETAVICVIYLDSSESNFPEDSKILRQIFESFKIVPIAG